MNRGIHELVFSDGAQKTTEKGEDLLLDNWGEINFSQDKASYHLHGNGVSDASGPQYRVFRHQEPMPILAVRQYRSLYLSHFGPKPPLAIVFDCCACARFPDIQYKREFERSPVSPKPANGSLDDHQHSVRTSGLPPHTALRLLRSRHWQHIVELSVAPRAFQIFTARQRSSPQHFESSILGS
jgi:hypothetical protein